MRESDDLIALQLHYFGSVTASISHELKNVLAILNEHAGLLRDYVAMSGQGRPLDPARIGHLAETMTAQIGRGDMIIKRMNRFAHSVDQEFASIDLGALITLVAALFERTAATRGVSIGVRLSGEARSIITRPFALETLLGRLLDGLSAMTPGFERLEIALVTEPECRIAISGLALEVETMHKMLEDSQYRQLLEALHAHSGYDQEHGELYILLPDRIDP